MLAVQTANQPAIGDFTSITRDLPAQPPRGSLRLRPLWLGLDPYIVPTIRGRHMGAPPIAAGAPLPGESLSQVLASSDPRFASGDFVVGPSGWAEQAILAADHVRKVDGKIAKAEHLGLLGMPGLTAWAGMMQLANVKPGDIVTIDAAAGIVGGTAGQLARLAGARVVGIAGGPEKCRLVTERYGFDDCIDYHQPGWQDRLPENIAVHFENVGQTVLDAIIPRLKLYGHIVLCGLAQHYGDGSKATLPVGALMGRRATVAGLIVYDFYPRLDEWVAFATPLLANGSLVEVEDIAEGLDVAPAHLLKVASGKAVGRALVHIQSEA